MAAGADPTGTTSPAGSAPTTTRRSRGCTRRRGTSSAPASRRPARCGPGRSTTPPTSPAACTTRCPTGRAASASTTTWRWRSAGCSTNGAKKVAYVDVDVHHGDGVEQIFYDDPRVLTISLHETGQMLFPGTGFPADSGGPGRRGLGGQRRAASGHGRRRLAARLPRRRAAAGPRVRARRAGHPAGLRQPPRRPAGPPRAQRRRPARELPRPARAGPRGRERTLGRLRRRWVLRRRRRARARGRTCWPWSRAARSVTALETPVSWRDEVTGRLGVRAPSRMTDGRTAGVPRLVRGLRPRHLARPGGPGDEGCGVPLERSRSADLRVWDGCGASGHAEVSLFTLGNLWHIGHIWPYISYQTARVVRSGEAVGRATRKCGAPCPRTLPETSPT